MNQPLDKSALLSAQHRPPAPASQATHIEQSRAIAQVQGALVVAQQRPRDQIAAGERMREACQVAFLAERAFFRYSRAGSQISGPSIHLASELARCWGNVDYGISQLRRDDAKGESEMLAYAWDLETNNRVTNTFIVPHKRDTKGGAKELVDMRDIYENNANQAARRLRECIFRVLPTSYLEEAKQLCMATMEHGGGEAIEVRRTKLLEAFAGLKVTRSQIERKIGRAADHLTAYDIGVLRVVFQSIRRGEIDVREEFPDDSGAQVGQQLRQQAGAPTPQHPNPPPASSPVAAAEPAPEPSGAREAGGEDSSPSPPAGTPEPPAASAAPWATYHAGEDEDGKPVSYPMPDADRFIGTLETILKDLAPGSAEAKAEWRRNADAARALGKAHPEYQDRVNACWARSQGKG